MKTITSTTLLESGKLFESVRVARQHACLSKNPPPPTSFREIFGDLSDCHFEKYLNLDNLNLNSLEGSPKSYDGSFLAILNNPELKNLKDLPIPKDSHDRKIYVDFDMNYSDSHNDLEYLLSEHHNFCIVFSDTGDKLGHLNIEFLLILNFFWIRHFNGSFAAYAPQDSDFKDIAFNAEAAENYYQIFKKVNFDRNKFVKVFSLL